MRSSPTPAAPHWEARTWALLAVLCGVLFLDGLDVSMVGMALPSIREELDLSTSQLQWVVSGYVLGYGGLLLLGGRAADLLGRRRVLLVGLSVFVVASAVGGLVNDGTLLVVTRVLKGMSAAFTAPAGLSIITTTFSEGPNRNRALAYYTATGASGFSLGLVFGGLLTELGWRWTFLLPVPFALAILLVAPRVIPRDRLIPGTRRRYDVAGAVTITAAILLLVRTVVEAPASGWGDPTIVGSFVAVLALLAAFVAIELRTPQPLVRLGILRKGSLVRANLGMATMFGAYVGFQFVGTLYLQEMHGWSPVETALAFLPGGLLVAFGSPRIGPLVDRYGTPPPSVENLLEVARFRAHARGAGLHEVVLQGRHVRFGPVDLRDWQQVRLNRVYPRSLVKPAVRTILVPRPSTRPVGGEPLRNAELLRWARKVIDDVLLDAPATASAG